MKKNSTENQIKGIEEIRKKQFRLKISIFIIGILPFCFYFCRMINSHTARFVIPLAIVSLIFLSIIIYAIKNKAPQVIFGIFLIIPIFICACLAFADMPLFLSRADVAKFISKLPPSESFLFGTDYEGRDILATIVIGGLHAYIIAVMATFIALVTGVFSGMLLTVKNPVIRNFATAITQFFEIVPKLFFILIVLGVYNFWAAADASTRLVTYYSVPIAAFAIGLSSLPSIARVVENKVMQLKQHRFVPALQSSNVSNSKILFKNILWNNCTTEILIQATFIFGATILIESAIGYAFEIGFGDLGTGGYLSWGKILAEARRSILFAENFWIVLFPILVTIMSILGSNMLGDIFAKHLRGES